MPVNADAYIVYQGMRARQRALDVLANNIANASTSGFKADRLLYRSFEAAQQEAATTGAAPNTTAPTAAESDAEKIARERREINIVTSGATDFSQGSIRPTGRSLDVALNGDGFFAVQTPRGERYTRAGSFSLDAAGQLVTSNGDLILGGGGPVTVPPGEVSFGTDGTISVNGRNIDRLKIVRFNDARNALVKEGSSLFAAAPGVRPRENNQTSVEGGALEMSNVNSITEMAAMMQNNREFESLQKSISLMMNELGRKISSEVGRI